MHGAFVLNYSPRPASGNISRKHGEYSSQPAQSNTEVRSRVIGYCVDGGRQICISYPVSVPMSNTPHKRVASKIKAALPATQLDHLSKKISSFEPYAVPCVPPGGV